MARVLYVEDDDITREIVAAQLERGGHQVLPVESGAAALVALDERGAAEIAVLDVGLPDMDGYALLERLRERADTSEMPVIFLTARVDEREVDRGREAGARYLTKPFVASALLEHIDRALRPAGSAGW